MYKLIKQGKLYNTPIKKFICNTYEEALQINENILFGSVLYVISTQTFFIYNSNNEWVEQKGSIDYV